MAASFYSNSIHVDFDSVLAMAEPGMVSMFQALVASGLQGFLGCSTVVYEEALAEFFANGHVRDGLVVSSVNGAIVEIFETVSRDDAEATKEALSHQLLKFQSQAQENHNVIHAQLSELVDYIHRGSAEKKGESGSRGLQQPANVQIEGSAVTPTFEQRVEMAQRRIVHTVLDADRALLARQDAAERDRE
ncbi:hypothetical protein F511_19103 [Dorcoceras hygrometricum]|uniref:Uncharacterized protein n=1 Tax=Dorcoceras hygrometricum TaxID=472368 RepID=A0A2Z7AZ20_9LAMI|nr:hypothetical protein F511_19103 [Dorcoceras hygrometricum]